MADITQTAASYTAPVTDVAAHLDNAACAYSNAIAGAVSIVSMRPLPRPSSRIVKNA
jgi:hypothetical protein